MARDAFASAILSLAIRRWRFRRWMQLLDAFPSATIDLSKTFSASLVSYVTIDVSSENYRFADIRNRVIKAAALLRWTSSSPHRTRRTLTKQTAT